MLSPRLESVGNRILNTPARCSAVLAGDVAHKATRHSSHDQPKTPRQRKPGPSPAGTSTNRRSQHPGCDGSRLRQTCHCPTTHRETPHRPQGRYRRAAQTRCGQHHGLTGPSRLAAVRPFDVHHDGARFGCCHRQRKEETKHAHLAVRALYGSSLPQPYPDVPNSQPSE